MGTVGFRCPRLCFGPLLVSHVNHLFCATMDHSEKMAKPKVTARQAMTKQRATNIVDKVGQDESFPSRSRREFKRRSAGPCVGSTFPSVDGVVRESRYAL